MGLFSSTSTDPRVLARLDAIERKLDAIMASFGVETPPGTAAVSSEGMDEVRTLALGGRKIEAIKRYRELTGVGLAEAKAYVDGIRG